MPFPANAVVCLSDGHIVNDRDTKRVLWVSRSVWGRWRPCVNAKLANHLSPNHSEAYNLPSGI